MAFHKGQTPWNKGKKGLQKCTDVAKEKHRLSAIKNGLGKVNHVAWNKGTKGICKAWNKGLKGFLGGEKHYNWQGGKSSEAYGLEFNDDLKEVIRNRDRRKCYLCEKTELENGEKLSVHHIDYEKTNNNPNNLITLCRVCHRKTNDNRNSWTKFFQQIWQ